jgi:hypothetical protein
MIFDALCRHIAQQQSERLREVVDLSIKNRVRLWRLPNTVHEKSKLYKISLTHLDLKNLNADEIRESATTARPVWLGAAAARA